MNVPDPREGRLPQWAQALLTRLRAEVRSRENEARELQEEILTSIGNGPKDSDTFMEHNDGSMPIGKRTLITFNVGEGMTLEVQTVRDGGIRVEAIGRNGIVIQPTGTKMIQILSRKLD